MEIVLATLCEIEMRDKGLRGRHLSAMLKNSSERKSKSQQGSGFGNEEEEVDGSGCGSERWFIKSTSLTSFGFRHTLAKPQNIVLKQSNTFSEN